MEKNCSNFNLDFIIGNSRIHRISPMVWEAQVNTIYLYSGAMMQTTFFQGLDPTFQQNCIDANIAEGQATNPATSQALGTQSCP